MQACGERCADAVWRMPSLESKPRVQMAARGGAVCGCLSFFLFIWGLIAAISAVYSDPIFHGSERSVADGPSQTGDNTFQMIRGVNIGGWLVLEPWVAPSMFYQFQDLDQHGIDEMNFCSILGAEESRRQMIHFLDTWVTEEDFQRIADMGLNSVRIPFGYWIEGDRPEFCPGINKTSYLDKAVEWCGKHGLQVNLQMHGAMLSQNGFDNSGQSFKYNIENWDENAWTTAEAAGVTQAVLAKIVARYADQPHVAFVGLVNEPHGYSMGTAGVEQYYYDSYTKVVDAVGEDAAARISPFLDAAFNDNEWEAPLTTHASTWNSAGLWGAMLDLHYYLSFGTYGGWYFPQVQTLTGVGCQRRQGVQHIAENELPAIVGEWSLSVADCQTWLQGAFKGAMHAPVDKKCGYVDCPTTYGALPASGAIAVDYDHSLPATVFAPPGQCPVDPLEVTRGPLDYDAFYKRLAETMIYAYERSRGWFFWNFKCEVEDPRWCYFTAHERGWFPANISTHAWVPPAAVCGGTWINVFGGFRGAAIAAGVGLILDLVIGVAALVTWCVLRRKGARDVAPLLGSANEPLARAESELAAPSTRSASTD